MTDSPPGRVLALDLGTKRIGLALSDPARTHAQPLATLLRKNRDADIAALTETAAREEATLLVMGLPTKLDGSLGEMATKALSFGKRLARRSGLPVEYVDEALSSVEAEEVLIAANVSRAKRKQVVDKLAATVILRRYLDSQGDSSC